MLRKLLIICLLMWAYTGWTQTTFFNEVDYKTAPPNQCLEIVSPDTTDRVGWEVHIYNGGGFIIESIDLGVIVPANTVNNLDIIIVDVVLLTDPGGGMVIEDNLGNIIQFLNYGMGTIMAMDGPAVGMTSENIGVQLAPGLSLQLTGSGVEYTDFDWGLPGAATCGLENLMQILQNSVPLPIELLYFKAGLKDQHIHTAWATASEYDSDYFILLRKVNGRPFEEVFRTEAAGLSSEPLEYTFVDRYPPDGNLYYQLVEIDFDGQTTKSEVVAVKNLIEDNSTFVFPNPVVDEMQIILPRFLDFMRIEIYDLSNGRLMVDRRIEQSDSHISLNVNYLDKGHYLLRLQSKQYIHEQRFIKLNMD